MLRLVASSLCFRFRTTSILAVLQFPVPSPRQQSLGHCTIHLCCVAMQANMVRLVEPTSSTPTFDLARTTHMASFAFKAYGAPAKHYDLAAQDQDGSRCLYLDADFIWAHFQAGIRVTVRWTHGLDDLIAAVRSVAHALHCALSKRFAIACRWPAC